MHPPRPTRGARAPDGPPAGFTVVEVVVVLGIFAVLAAVLLPLGAEILESERTDRARRELVTLKDAIVGSDVRTGSGADGDRGFVADLGQLPDSLEQLVRPGALPSFSVDPDARLGAGWRGPYLDVSGRDSASRFADPFGRPVGYTLVDTTVAGQDWAGFLQSRGPDGVDGTGDDLVVPLLESEVETTVSGFVVGASGEGVENVPVRLFFRRGGQVLDTVLTTDADGRYRSLSYRQGRFRVTLPSAGPGSGLALVPGSAEVSGANNDDLAFRVQNVTASPLTLSALTPTWTTARDGCPEQVVVDGTVRFELTGTEDIDRGERVPLSPTATVSGAGAASGSVLERRFRAVSPATLAPELRLGGTGTGGATATVELNTWDSCDGVGDPAEPRDIRGLQVDVTFEEGGTVSVTAPS